ncbi:MAG: hypothetical protein WD894_07275 [Pirellulales bacterium]
MDVSVILERVQENGYRATALVPVPLIAEAPTRDEAVARIHSLIGERLSNAELINVHVPSSTELNPWLAIAGTWRDHPEIDEVTASIETYRREVDSDRDRI